MVTATLPPSEARRLLEEFEKSLSKRSQGIPDIMTFGSETALPSHKAAPAVLDIPLKRIESTLQRVWGPDLPEIKITGFDERWRPDKPEVALIKTTAGDRVLKTEKPGTGQDGTINEGTSQLFYAELNLRSIRLGVDGLRRRAVR